MKRRTFMSSLLGALGLGMIGRARQSDADSGKPLLLQESPLAGCEYYKVAHVWPFLHEGEPLRLIREPTNAWDKNAVAVYFRGEKLGYVPRRENATLAQLMDRGHRLEARIVRLREEANPWRRLRLSVTLPG